MFRRQRVKLRHELRHLKPRSRPNDNKQLSAQQPAAVCRRLGSAEAGGLETGPGCAEAASGGAECAARKDSVAALAVTLCGATVPLVVGRVGCGTVVFWPSLFAYAIVFVWFILDHLGSYANVTVDVFRHLVKYAHLLTNAWQWLALSLVSVCALLCKTASSSVKMVGEKFKVTGEK